jgi:hypothetical protein
MHIVNERPVHQIINHNAADEVIKMHQLMQIGPGKVEVLQSALNGATINASLSDMVGPKWSRK